MVDSRAHRAPTQDGQHGFTIIELLLVLGMFGLIAMIVFMAIPALQRNGHNNSRRNDVAVILQGVSQYALNNSANFPTSINDLRIKKLAYYELTASKIHLVPSAPGSGPITAVTSLDEVYIYRYAKCKIDGGGQGDRNNADYRDIVAMFALERASGATPKCQQL